MVYTPHLSNVRLDLCFMIALLSGGNMSSMVFVGGPGWLVSHSYSCCSMLCNTLLSQYVPVGGGGWKYLVVSSGSWCLSLVGVSGV